MSLPPVTVLAATGRVGLALVRQLQAVGTPVIAIGRDPAKLAVLPDPVIRRVADLADPKALRAALGDARLVVSCAHASFIRAVLDALPAAGVERLVVMGSTRRFSAVPDWTAEEVRAAERHLADSAIPAVMLLATLIYGAGGSVADGLARLIRRCPVLPLPDGGRALVQPIHVEDVGAALAAAVHCAEPLSGTIIIAGPIAMRYGDLIRRIAAGIGRRVVILNLPAAPVLVVAHLAGRLPRLSGISGGIRRLVEDKAYDITDMRRRLGVEPRPFSWDA